MAQINSTTPAARLQMSGISKRFGATVALEDVSLTVEAGRVLALVGENGAGKSTLMKVLSGAIGRDAGQMQLDGEQYQPRNPLEARLRGVAMIYQELSLVPHLSVAENILLGMEPNIAGWIRPKQTRQRALKALSFLSQSHPEITPDVPVRQLSVGAQQLVEIARAMAVGCRVLVLDEPTSSLTQSDVQRLFELIKKLKDQGHAIVYISHFIEEVQQIADSVMVLRDGKTVGQSDIDKISTEEIISLMVGRQVKQLYPRSRRQRGEVILEFKDLTGQAKPHAAALKLHRGEVLGIAGLVGAGRTELLRSLFGLDVIRSGRIRLGVYSGFALPQKRWAQGMGMLSEDRKEEGLALSMSIADNVTLSRLKGFGPLGMVLPARQYKATVDWVQRLGIRCQGPFQLVQDLSGGNQQKVALARLLQHDVDVLLLDEPTRGIDVAAKAMIYKLIDELTAPADSKARKPKAIIMVSSYLPELSGVCDRVAVMCRGRLGRARPVSEIDEHKLMSEATGQEINS